MASLPGKAIIRLGRFVWSQQWHLMMSQMAPASDAGDYQRPESQFHHSVGVNGPHPPEANRYRLIVGLGCPWAHRTLVTRSLKGLEAAIAVTVVSPSPEEGGWVFDAPFLGHRPLSALYRQAVSGYGGRATVPVLWDDAAGAIVNNESAEIIVILTGAFNAVAERNVDLYPTDLKDAVDQWNAKIYPAVNNGVYRCGFAQSQAAYDRACDELFTALDEIEAVLTHQRYLCSDRLTLADVRLFTTLFRFDTVYYSLFKCSRQRIADYPNLSGYVRDIYQQPGVAATCDLDVVKRDYYGNLFPLNPGGLIPQGPRVDFEAAHDRDRKYSGSTRHATHNH
ncbi:MAG: glutathione S-transferase family protein, partial [Elainellaceae cyanobacterium]